MKVWHDQKARERTFNVGDRVLVLLPITGHPLQAKYHGPYAVEHQVNDVDYVVSTPDRWKQRQLCHINMLKKYHTKEDDLVKKSVAPVALLSPNDDEYGVNFLDDCGIRLNNFQILFNLKVKLGHLNQSQIVELKAIIQDNLTLFPDVPSRPNIVYHNVDVGKVRRTC